MTRPPGEASKEARLAAALRANLRRRKQERGTGAPAKPDPQPPLCDPPSGD